MATYDTSMVTRRAAPPTFAVQRAGGGKARIIALHPRLASTEAVTVTTVGDLTTAKRIAHLLNIAWNSGFGPFRVTDRQFKDLADLPDPVVKAIDDALAGCPPRGDRSGDERRHAEDKARLVADFGPAHTACQKTNDDDAEDCEPLLTPREALRLMGHLEMLGDSLKDDLLRDTPLDTLIDSTEILDAEDLPVGAQTKGWWNSFALAFFDLASDIKAGRNPAPATFAEIVALHRALSIAQDDNADDEKSSIGAWAWGERQMSEYGCDSYGWHDEMLLDSLFGNLTSGNDLIDCIENDVDFYAMLPAEQWHHPLPGRPQRDPARLLE
ncbi:hypothetical protein ABH926_010109 [Catenulispora sp. GP43]|uniref:hypothetical protein n=1 Tax=Catenulispora sp. GP43 TaxID=3156263 RepID=UPI003513239F